MKKLVFTIIFSFLLLFLQVLKVNAQTSSPAHSGLSPSGSMTDGSSSCRTIYGGGTSCSQKGNLIISKTIEEPSDSNYMAGQEINFTISVTNTSTTTMFNVIIKDIFPAVFEYVAGNGSYDSKTKTFSLTVGALEPKRTQTFSARGKLVISEKLESDVVCVANFATATINGQESSTNAQFCVQKGTSVNSSPDTQNVQKETPLSQITQTKGGLQVFSPSDAKTTPATGPEALPLLALIPTGIIGFLLRKKSSKFSPRL
ncbi:MAG: hypothetical protein ABIC96_04200 [Patescibacteria group bacterium]